MVCHAGVDDLGTGEGDKAEESKKTGNAGARLACGVIGMSGAFWIGDEDPIGHGSERIERAKAN